jgi:UDP-N-acetylenolpyruvoylglucosamine reductase
MITRRHANIMINTGHATAADVRALIDHVQEVVERRTGHRLEVEIAFRHGRRGQSGLQGHPSRGRGSIR